MVSKYRSGDGAGGVDIHSSGNILPPPVEASPGTPGPASRSPWGEMGPDRRQEFLIVHRFGDVAITPCGSNALLVALHRQGGEGDHRNGARRVVPLEQPRRFEAVYAGKLDVHQ